MNHVLRSGYLTPSEIYVKCGVLSTSHRNTIPCFMKQQHNTNYNSTNSNVVLFLEKGKRSICTKCQLKRLVRIDPFQWVKGVRCKKCMPKYITYTNARRLLRNRRDVDRLDRLKRVHKLSPYGRNMRVFLLADIVTLTNKILY